jgi:hypothetical protein
MSDVRSHMAARVLQGVSAGAAEAPTPLIVQDIIVLRQRNEVEEM